LERLRRDFHGNSADVRSTVGTPPKGSAVPLGRFSRLYDVLNGVVVDADFCACEVGERVLAGVQLASTEAQDPMLYDCGNPAFRLFVLHQVEQHPILSPRAGGLLGRGCGLRRHRGRSAVVTFTPRSNARR
jgi:hypothetical protein